MIKILLRTIAVLAVLLVLLVVAVRFLNPPLPDTDAMRAYFQERKAAFERNHAEVSAALAAKRAVQTGRNDAVGYEFLIRAPGPPNGIVYLTHTQGFGVGIHGTGVARLESPPDSLYPSLEAMYDDARAVEGFIGYGLIADGWYFVLWEAD